MKKNLLKLTPWMRTHRVATFFISLAIIGIGYYTYTKVFPSGTTTQYILGTVRKGTITNTVTGSAQVSSENQLDVTSEVSAKVISINATVGQHVQAGDLLATLDSRDALLDLENAKIAYAKLTEPAKVGDVTNAENNLNKSYNDGFAAISGTFLNLPAIMSGLKDILTSRTGYLSDQQAPNINETGRGYRLIAAASFDRTNTDYNTLLDTYRSLTKNSSSAVVEDMLTKVSVLEKELAETLKVMQSTYTYISMAQPDYNVSAGVTASASLTTWSNQVSSDLSSLLSAKNSIASYGDTLKKLRDGADSLDIQSEELSLEQKRRTYAKYFIRAPFEGIVGRIPVHVYDQANNGTVIATISSNKKVTTIPLNEVDAVKVATGQRAELTFDAVSGLKIDGIVSQVDLVGTASQGVVTYNVRITFDGSDTRIRPGMSVDASIITQEKSDILVVPAGAVKTQNGKNSMSYVEVLDAQGAPQRKTVTTGATDDTNIEIVSGLNEGDKIVVRTIVGTTAVKSTTPSLFSGLSGGQRNALQGGTRAGGAGAARTTTAR